jgi:putative phosphoribosyl transferase
MQFADRAEAGRRLADMLAKYHSRQGVVYALPRGGVIVAVEVARRLGWPLDLIIARKIGHPMQPEYAIAAITGSGEIAVNTSEVEHIDRRWFERAAAAERAEAQRRQQVYLGGRTAPDVRDRIAIVIDDGIATGLTVRAALTAMRARKPSRLILAVPVVPDATAVELSPLVDEIVAIDRPHQFLGSVGSYYRDFHQISDEEVIAALAQAETIPGS